MAANLEVTLESLGTRIDATGGVHHGGAQRVTIADEPIELAWVASGDFDELDSP